MPTPTRKSTAPTTHLVAALLLSLGLPVVGAAQQMAPRVEWNAERLTLVADDASLDALLREVAVKTGSRVVGLEHATERVSVDIRNARLIDAMRQLLSSARVNYLYMLRTSPVTSADRVVLRLYGATAPKPGAMRDALVVDASEPAGNETALLGGYAPRTVDNEVTRLHREGAFDVHATQASLLGLTKSTDPEVRILALQTLALQPTALTAEAIRAAVNDENIFVRGEAIVLLGALGQGKDAVSTLGALVDHEDPEVRGVAALVLGEQPGDEAEQLLRRALNDGDRAVRGFAAQSLRQKAASGKPKP